jgi:DegV family protein with EDD domain
MSKHKIAIVTDSSAYIPKEIQAGLDIHVIPVWLIWDGKSYRDGVDIDSETFYKRLVESEQLPTTSQPTCDEFKHVYQRLAEDVDAIVNVLVSSKISGTIDNAQAAITELPEIDIRIVDSLFSSAGLCLAVLEAARAAAAGKSAGEVVAAAEKARDNSQLLFIADTLEYLYKGGRISGGKRLLGTALKIKPILQFEEGYIRPLSQARTSKKAIVRLLEIIAERLADRKMEEAIIVDINNEAGGSKVKELIIESFKPEKVFRSGVSPVVGTHVGPGAIGVAFRMI